MDAFDPSSIGLLDRERIVAKPGFNRWLVPPAALAIHLCIGMAYGFSVFWIPLSRALGISKSVVCKDMGVLTALTTTTCDWRVGDLADWMFPLFFVFLGSSAAVCGAWVERAGPRKTGVVAALCWSTGFGISAVGIATHQLWLTWLGSGVIGGIGLGLGYISPVSTLIKWFPDRRGMATGMAIMGFGGGAMIGAPLADLLMNSFRTSTDVGVWQTFLVLGAIYLVFMLAGAFGYRVPPAGWVPEGWTPPQTKAMITARHVHPDTAIKTPQFWLIWAVLCLNVSAGIGVLDMASPMLQEIFGGKLIGAASVGFAQLDPDQGKRVATIAAGFTGLLSLCNITGRFLWASFSDRIGRKLTYTTFFALGIALYALSPTAARAGTVAGFVVMMCIILSMYGGGFATVPAYLADIFGTQFVGAIHGRLLTAWSVAGILGPWVVNHIRQAQLDAGVSHDRVYDRTMLILAGFLVVGLVVNQFVRPLAAKWFMSDDEVAKAQSKAASATATTSSHGIGLGGLSGNVILAWLAVGVPLAWGVWKTVTKALQLFS
jgi:MFS family permease